MAVHLLGSGALLSAFVVTEAETLSFTLQPPGLAVVQRTVLDPQGAASARCTCMRDHLLLVGRDQGVYEYTLDSRAGCSAFEGRKALLAPLGRYLLLVTTAIASEDGVATSTVSLTDVRNKLVAGSFTLPNVRTVLPAFGASVYVLTGGGAVLLLHELELAAQLEALLRRAQFKLALDIGRGQGLEGEGLAAIHQRWADHLYARGEYDAAMGQYTQTIGHLEPSYVIRRFLDAQRIACLTAYLEALHEQGAAAADHTTLLLNCYTKLKDLAKLDAFLQRYGRGCDSDGHSRLLLLLLLCCRKQCWRTG